MKAMLTLPGREFKQTNKTKTQINKRNPTKQNNTKKTPTNQTTNQTKNKPTQHIEKYKLKMNGETVNVTRC